MTTTSAILKNNQFIASPTSRNFISLRQEGWSFDQVLKTAADIATTDEQIKARLWLWIADCALYGDATSPAGNSSIMAQSIDTLAQFSRANIHETLKFHANLYALRQAATANPEPAPPESRDIPPLRIISILCMMITVYEIPHWISVIAALGAFVSLNLCRKIIKAEMNARISATSKAAFDQVRAWQYDRLIAHLCEDAPTAKIG